jgi:hypothetical protein
MAGVNWYGAQFDAELNAKVERKLDAAAIKVSTRVKKLLSVPGTAKRKQRSKRIRVWRAADSMVNVGGRDDKGKFKVVGKIKAGDSDRARQTRLRDRKVWLGEYSRKSKGSVIFNASHAPAGEPPYKQTGRLRASITWEKPGPMVRRVGTNVKYARNQELGITVNPHPFLRPGLADSRPDIDRLFSS